MVPPGDIKLALADFTGDGPLDILTVTRQFPNASAAVLRGLGDGNFESLVTVPDVAQSVQQLVVVDIDGDDRPDAAIASRESDGVAILLGRGDLDGLNTGEFARQPLYLTGGLRPETVALGDFDKDGDLDGVATYESFDGNFLFTEMSLLENRRTP